RLEVVEDVLHLRPARDAEPEPAEQVDQLVGGLGERVPVAEPRAGRPRAGDVDAGDGGLGALDARFGGLPGGLERLLDGVEAPAVVLAGGGLDELEPLLGGLDPALLLAEVLDPGGLDRDRVAGLAEGR